MISTQQFPCSSHVSAHQYSFIIQSASHLRVVSYSLWLWALKIYGLSFSVISRVSIRCLRVRIYSSLISITNWIQIFGDSQWNSWYFEFISNDNVHDPDEFSRMQVTSPNIAYFTSEIFLCFWRSRVLFIIIFKIMKTLVL